MKINNHNKAFFVILLIQYIYLIYIADSFDISFKEAIIYFDKYNSILHWLMHISTDIFGETNRAIRLPFILFYIFSSVLIYLFTKDYLKKEIDRVVSVTIFMILPGSISAGLVINEAIIVTFLTLMYLYIYQKTKKNQYWLLFLMLFIDNSFFILYLALMLYSLQKKDKVLFIISIILFYISATNYNFNIISGYPRGYFLDTFGLYVSIFSPFLFLFFMYSLYRAISQEKKDLYFYIVSVSFILSLLVSLRQRIIIEDFASFIIIGISIATKFFMHSYRIRLPQFRKRYYILASFIVITLVINFLILTINKPLYFVLNEPDKHFANDYHIAKDLADKLKDAGVNKVLCQDAQLQLRLKYYKIEKGTKLYLSTDPIYFTKKMKVKYMKETIKTYYIRQLK